MSEPAANGSRKPKSDLPYHVSHPTFERADAEALYGPDTVGVEPQDQAHMPDEQTRDLAKRMHYAAWRAAQECDGAARQHWHATYLHFRDRVVLGNHKLIYRAVRRWVSAARADDMVGDCQIVLIQAVAAYNPWLGIRFSTYAFTCLMRALSRLTQKQTADRLSRSLPLESLPDGEPRDEATEEPVRMARIDEYLSEHHALLSSREKRVLTRRFSLDDQARAGTLEQIGREMGLSKERVRQVQASALDKLRTVLLGGASAG